MNSSIGVTGDRLIETMRAAAPDARISWNRIQSNLQAMKLPEAEINYFCEAVTNTEDNNDLVDLLAGGLWDSDRAMMHVMTRSYPLIIQIIRNAQDVERRNPTAAVKTLLEQQCYQEWTYASRANDITDAEYDELSLYLNAQYLAKVIYLHQSVRNSLRMQKDVFFPLMGHNDIVVPATATIVKVWEALRAARNAPLENRKMTIDSVLGIARAVQENPEVGERLVDFATERGYFEINAALDYAQLPAQALSTGVL